MTNGDGAAGTGGLDPRLLQIVDVVMRLASGEYDARAQDSGCGDEFDALAVGINMLIEEVVAKFGENAKLVHSLGESMERLSAQQQTIMSLSTPALRVWEGIVVLPLIGLIDSARVQRLSKELLMRVVQDAVDVVIIDVTGLAEMDTTTARLLLDVVGALRLLGARCILTGLRAQNARNMVSFDVDMGAMAMRASLYDGLKLALSMTGRKIIDAQTRRGT